MPYKDPAKKRAWAAAKRLDPAEQERSRAYGRAHYAANRERLQAQARAYLEQPGKREQQREAVRRWREVHGEAWRIEHQRAVLMLNGELVNANSLPPEAREVAVLLKQVRRIIRGENSARQD
jgi:hypothetical protein